MSGTYSTALALKLISEGTSHHSLQQ